MGIKISRRDLGLLQKDVNKAVSNSMSSTYRYFRRITPKKSGNARSKTDYDQRNLIIEADYPYAARLDTGWSKQAPRGMTEPSVKHLESQITKNFRRI